MRWQENVTKRKISKKIKWKAWWQIRKNKPKITKFSQKHAQNAFRNKLKQKIAINFEEKAIGKTKICKKQAQKTSKFQLKQAQKQATRKFSKKPATPQKNKPNFVGKPQGWQHWIPTFGIWMHARGAQDPVQDSNPAGFSTFWINWIGSGLRFYSSFRIRIFKFIFGVWTPTQS